MKPFLKEMLVMIVVSLCILGGKTLSGKEALASPHNSSTIVVTKSADSGPGSLREAISIANTNGAADTIVFHDSLKGATIQPLSGLPSLTEGGATINGDIDSNGTPDIEIDGSLAGEAEGINILSSNNVIRGLVINRTHYSGIGIHTSAGTNNIIVGNYIGLDKTGTSELGTSNCGIYMAEGARRNTVGGVLSADRNIISGNKQYNGIAISADCDSNVIVNNFVGTDVSGTVAFGNGGDGILISSRYNLVKNNLVSGGSGVWFGGITLYGPEAYGNVVVGNFIGTDSSGTKVLGNTGAGVGIYSGAHDNIIGGINSGEGNLISGNGNGVSINGGGSDGNILLGNFIGTALSGTAALPNVHGVTIVAGAKSNTIGGTITGAGNLISGNEYNGVAIDGEGSDRNNLLGNFIGTNITGTVALPNKGHGVAMTRGAKSNTIGGVVPGAGNLISGNGVDQWALGVAIVDTGTDSNLVLGNKIGTDISGTKAIGNRNVGVHIANGAKHNQIGGTDSLVGNLISGNGDPNVQGSGDGVTISGEGTDYNRVLRNRIGTNVSGAVALPNLNCGITITNGASANIIGGSTTACRNLISGNNYQGIVVVGSGANNNQIIGNYIGTNAMGTVAIPNGRISGVEGLGIVLQSGAKANQIGGANPGEGNLISGNKGSGILINWAGADSNRIIGNYIGTTADGLSSLANGANGIFIREAACYNQVGGSMPGEQNVISGNKGSGIRITQSGTRGNQIIGNHIGTTADGLDSLGNEYDGIYIYGTKSLNRIGGTNTGESNIIAYNKKTGIEIQCYGPDTTEIIGNTIHSNHENGISILYPGTGYNLVSRNSVFNNAGLGIYYFPDYRFPFSPPVILSASAAEVSGYASLPDSSIVEVFSDQDDEGEIYIGSAIVLDSNFTYSGIIPSWTHLTTTGTDRNKNTSTFSIPYFNRPVQSYPYFNNLETNDGNYAHQGTWTWGAPVYGPKQAFSGSKVWASTLDSVTLNYNYQYLELPPIDLSSATHPSLSFMHWYSFEKGYDGGNVKISSDGGKHFSLIEPAGGYDDTLVYVMLGESTFTGESERYIQEVFSLEAFAGDTVIIRFHFAADPWIQKSGWYIDDISVAELKTKDVGVASIDTPGSSVDLHLITTPLATVMNFGYLPQDFGVEMTIESSGNKEYACTVQVSGLQPLSTTQVEFTPWTPSHAGIFDIRTRTLLQGDENRANDSVWCQTTAVDYIFSDVTDMAGVGDTGSSNAGAWGDFDGDGDLDLYVVKSISQWFGAANTLFKNNGAGLFEDVAEQVGLADTGIGTGGIWGDYDNDGYLDLYVINFTQPNVLYRNDGGMFTDVTPQAKVGDSGTGNGASWVDYDRDGDLDIFVYNCTYGGQHPTLYRNDGGVFVDISDSAGIAGNFTPHNGPTIAWGDYNNDGYPDLYLPLGDYDATYPNMLFCNNGNGTFTNIADSAGVADTGYGRGAAWGDYDNDGELDLYVVNYWPNHGNVLFRNNGNGTFTNVTTVAGVGDTAAGRMTFWGDYDNDGFLDLAVANEGVNKLYHNKGDGTFQDVTFEAGLNDTSNTRGGLLWGDYDNDGDLDLYEVNLDSKNRLYRNNGSDNHFLSVKTVGVVSNRDGIGARIKVVAGSLSQIREVNGGVGSQIQLPVHCGLGTHSIIDSLIITWPSGIKDVYTNVAVDQHMLAIEGATVIRESPLNISIIQNSVLTKFIDIYISSTWKLQGSPFAQMGMGSEAPDTIKLDILTSQTYKGSYVFGTSGTCSLFVHILNDYGIPKDTVKLFNVKLIEPQSGGKLVSYNGKLQIVVPSEAVADSTYFTCIPVSEDKPSDLVQDKFLGVAYQLGPAKRNFRKDLTIVFKLDDYNLTEEEKNKLCVYKQEGDDWMRVESYMKIEDNTVSAKVKELGVYRLGSGEAEPQASLPKRYALFQNFPNPFNPHTVIKYDLPNPGQVKLTIYNVLGQKVITLVDQYQDPDHKAISWDGKDNRQKEVSSGVYFYRIEVNGYAETKKMILIK